MNADATAGSGSADGAPPAADTLQTQPGSRKAIAVAVGLLFVLLVLTGLLVWFLAADAARTALIRDIVLVLVVSLSLLINIALGGVLILLIFRLQDLTKMLRDEIQPTLANMSETVRTITGTAKMVSDQVAKPTIKAASFIAGVQGAARAARRRFNGVRSSRP